MAELKQRGFEMQEKLMTRIVSAEDSVEDFKLKLENNERKIKFMDEKL